jgi:hypothetical protein
MGAKNGGNQSAFGQSAFGVDAGAVQESLAQATMMPKKMLEANLRASSTLLSFASHRMQAQSEYFGRLLHCASVEQAAAMHKEYFEALIGDTSRELNALMEIARENSALFAPQRPDTSTSAKNG